MKYNFSADGGHGWLEVYTDTNYNDEVRVGYKLEKLK